MSLLPSGADSLRDKAMNAMEVGEDSFSQLTAACSRCQEGRWCKLSCSEKNRPPAPIGRDTWAQAESFSRLMFIMSQRLTLGDCHRPAIGTKGSKVLFGECRGPWE